MPDFALFHEDARSMRRIRMWSLFLAGSIVFLDQITKWVITKSVAFAELFSVVPGFAITLRHNTGAAFSFLADEAGWQRWFFVSIALLMSLIIFVWLGRLSGRDRREAVALSFILGGALGNVIDRIAHGYVIDFIVLYYQNWQWPAFNVADTAITLGAVLFTMGMFNSKKS